MDNNKIEIIPSPGTDNSNWQQIEEKIVKAKEFAKTLHVDIVDGIFAPNKTLLDPEPYKKYSKDLLLEVHLMTDNPIQYIKPFADSGFKRFIGHAEKMPSITDFIAEGQIWGSVGIAIDVATEVDALNNINLDNLDVILIMTVKAGRSGQNFTEQYLEKVRVLRQRTNTPIEIDGGITDETILKAKDSGASRFVATSFIWNSENPKEAYEKLSDLLK